MDTLCDNCGQPVRFTGGEANGFGHDWTHANGLLKCEPDNPHSDKAAHGDAP